jgi:hypothetical protein
MVHLLAKRRKEGHGIGGFNCIFSIHVLNEPTHLSFSLTRQSSVVLNNLVTSSVED